MLIVLNLRAKFLGCRIDDIVVREDTAEKTTGISILTTKGALGLSSDRLAISGVEQISTLEGQPCPTR